MDELEKELYNRMLELIRELNEKGYDFCNWDEVEEILKLSQ